MIVKLLKWSGVSLLVLAGSFFLLRFWIDSHRPEFYRKVSKALHKNFDGEIEIGDFGFTPFRGGPGLTFSLYRVRITDPQFHTHGTPSLAADVISVSLSPASLFSDRIRIKSVRLTNGTLHVFRRKDGYSNLGSFVRSRSGNRAQGDRAARERIRKIHFENIRLTYSDSLREKKMDVFLRASVLSLSRKGDLWEGDLQGSILFYGLYFNPDKGGFLVNQETLADFKMSLDSREKKIKLNRSRLLVAGHHQIEMSGQFAYGYRPLRWNMDFDTRDIPLDKALRLLPRKIEKEVSGFRILPVMSGKVAVSDTAGTKHTTVDISFKTDTFRYDFPFGKLNRLKAEGTFTNRKDRSLPPGNSNSMIRASRIDGFFESLPISTSLVLTDFDKPQATLKCSLSADPASLNKLFDPKRYRVSDGSLHLNLVYKGDMHKLYDEKADRINGSIAGEISIRNAALSYYPQKVRLRELNSHIVFDQEQIVVKSLSVNDTKNTLHITGKVNDLLLALCGSRVHPRAEVNIHIPDWQLNWLEVLLDKQPAPGAAESSGYKLSRLADEAIENMEIVGNLRSDRLQYHKFSARNLRGQMEISGRGISLNHLYMHAFGGTVELDGALEEPADSAGHSRVHLNGRIEDTRVHSVFHSFNNFGQKTITDQNIKGRLTSDFKLNALLNKDASLVDSSMYGHLSFSLVDGSIVNFKPFLKVKKMFFRTRSLENVKFAPIANSVEIRGNEVIVKPMEIESNVITLFVEGIYSFADKTDIVVQIPFSNLKKRDPDYRFVKHDPKALKSLYLRAVEEDGEVNIKLDQAVTEKRNKAVNKQ